MHESNIREIHRAFASFKRLYDRMDRQITRLEAIHGIDPASETQEKGPQSAVQTHHERPKHKGKRA